MIVCMKLKEVLKIVALPVTAASLCCLSSVVIVLAGVGSVTFASSLADTLYGEYKWVFRGIGILLLTLSLMMYLRTSKGVCTLDQVKKRKKEVINLVLISLFAGILGYLFFLYVVVHYVGVWLDLWV